MKKLLLILTMLFSLSLFGQSQPKYLSSESIKRAINTGVVVVEFGAKFAKSYSEWDKLEDCNYYRVDIENYPELKEKYKIRSVPTIILFYNGNIEEKWRANIMLELDVEVEEIQEEIERLLSSRF